MSVLLTAANQSQLVGGIVLSDKMAVIRPAADQSQFVDGIAPTDERWRFHFPNKAKSDDGVARRVGRSPERSEGSSRSKRRAALGDWRKLESPGGLAGVRPDGP